MVQIGDSFENPITKERFVWRATAASTGGEYCEFDLHLGPGATLAAAHRHAADGLLELAGDRAVLTLRGRLLADLVVRDLVD